MSRGDNMAAERAITESLQAGTLHAVPLNHSLRNGWNATEILYRDDSEAAFVKFVSDDGSRKIYTPLRHSFCDFARFTREDTEPALQAPPGALDYLGAAVDAKIRGHRQDRHTQKRADAQTL